MPLTLTLTSCERVSHIPRSVFADLARRLRNGDVKLVDLSGADECDDCGRDVGGSDCSSIENAAVLEALKAMS